MLRVLLLESFIAFFVFISTLSEEGEEANNNRLLLPIIGSIIFSSIPSRIPRNNERRNRRRKRRRVTSPFVFYSYQTVYCVSTIYTRRKLCFILQLERKKVEKMLTTTKRGISERHHHRTRCMESTSSSVARVRRPVVCARARVRCLKCCVLTWETSRPCPRSSTTHKSHHPQ